MSNKFEQLLDLIVNEETQKAEQLFHEIVVERSRSIYEGLLQDADQDIAERIGGDSVDGLADEIQAEEEEIQFEGEDDEDDNKKVIKKPSQPEVKRGRGRPAGSKSGARDYYGTKKK